MTMISGCMDSTACCESYDPVANMHDQTECIYYGCRYSNALNFDESPYVVNSMPMCTFKRRGCMDSDANNYDPWANVHVSGQCRYSGCTDSSNPGFDPSGVHL